MNNNCMDAFNAMFAGSVPTSMMDDLVESDNDTRVLSFLPGDGGWMENLYFDKLPPEKQRDLVGEEGFNVIAIGGGQFVPYSGDRLMDHVGVQSHVIQFESVPRNAFLSDFKFRGRRKPKVPKFCE